MNIDSHFIIGSLHRICQDYTIHNESIAILCDGCSSAEHSDIGARILAHSLLKEVDGTWRDVLHTAKSTVEVLDLPIDSLCTTILTATAEDGMLIGTMLGDGCIVSRRKDGELEIFNLEFVSGAPYYLRYEMPDENGQSLKNGYIKEFGDAFKINGVVQEKGFFEVYPTGLVVIERPIEDYDLMAIFSDGVNSFQRKLNTGTSISIEAVPAEEIIKEMLNIRGFAGSFVQRRCSKAINSLKEQGCVNTDDLSVGVIKV